MLEVTDLPTLNASLNALAALLLFTGWLFIRRRLVRPHLVCMVAAVVVSTAFLVSYLVYHAQVGSVRFQGTGAIRGVYFTILVTHTILATTVPFLAAVTLVRALRRRFERHRAIARWTLPVWLYVSVTGVVVYVMLYWL